MSATATVAPPRSGRRIAGQAALLVSGYAAGQALSFARNALLGHWLAKGDFGVGAAIILALQFIEILSDIGTDRFIVQSPRGDDPVLAASAHAISIVRGLLIGGLLYLAAHPAAAFFRVEQAAAAFEAVAIVPIIKGFCHIDPRRLQRKLDNRAFIAVEVLPQAAALLVTIPLIERVGDYTAVVWIAIVQAATLLVLSHILAERRYQLRLDRAWISQMLSFGWPIWLSAIPLVAVYQGERLLVGRMFGVEALASYTAVFMLAMVPGLAAARVGQALMLPLLSEVRSRPRQFRIRMRLMSEGTTLAAGIYAAVFIIAGGAIIPLAFGPGYRGLGGIAGWLGLMWALRMVQAVPGMAVMAMGSTGALLTAGIVRAIALPIALVLVMHGANLTMVAAAGVLGEIASLLVIAFAAGQIRYGLTRIVLVPSLFLFTAVAIAMLVRRAVPIDALPMVTIAAALAATSAVTLAGLALLPALRHFVDFGQKSRAPAAARASA